MSNVIQVNFAQYQPILHEDCASTPVKPYKPHRLVDKYTKLIERNYMTKSEINAMRKALGGSSKLVKADKDEILRVFYKQVEQQGGIEITVDHKRQGIEYLKRIAFRKDGTKRQTKQAVCFGDRELTTLKTFKEFRLVGLVNNSSNMYPYYFRVWRVLGKQTSFEYMQEPMGGYVEIVG